MRLGIVPVARDLLAGIQKQMFVSLEVRVQCLYDLLQRISLLFIYQFVDDLERIHDVSKPDTLDTVVVKDSAAGLHLHASADTVIGDG